MGNPFFERPILNSPYEYPQRYWELDGTGQPTQTIINSRRPADFVTPIPRPRRQRGQGQQGDLALGNDAGLSTENQQYAQAAIIRQVRTQVDRWRELPESQWRVTPETARLLRHWRHHLEKAATMRTYWVPGVNNLKDHGRWAFAEFTDVYAMQEDFAKVVQAGFNEMVETATQLAETEITA